MPEAESGRRSAGWGLLAGAVLALAWMWLADAEPVPELALSSAAPASSPTPARHAALVPVPAPREAPGRAAGAPEKPSPALEVPAEQDIRFGEAVAACVQSAERQIRRVMAQSPQAEPEQKLADLGPLLAQAAASADPKRRAAALWLATQDLQRPGPACPGADCLAEQAQRSQRRVAVIEQLASLAAARPAEPVLAWAWQACASLAESRISAPSCAALGPERWAVETPDNAWPWLLLAQTAGARGDAQGAGAALQQAAQAPNWRSPGVELRAALQGWPQQDAAWTARLAAMVLKTQATVDAEATVVADLSQRCRMPDPSCLALSAQMLEQADNFLVLSLATGMAQRQGLDAERIEAAQRERRLYGERAAFASGPLKVGAFCRHEAWLEHMVEQSDRLGERAAWRRATAPRAP